MHNTKLLKPVKVKKDVEKMTFKALVLLACPAQVESKDEEIDTRHPKTHLPRSYSKNVWFRNSKQVPVLI